MKTRRFNRSPARQVPLHVRQPGLGPCRQAVACTAPGCEAVYRCSAHSKKDARRMAAREGWLVMGHIVKCPGCRKT